MNEEKLKKLKDFCKVMCDRPGAYYDEQRDTLGLIEAYENIIDVLSEIKKSKTTIADELHLSGKDTIAHLNFYGGVLVSTDIEVEGKMINYSSIGPPWDKFFKLLERI